MVPIRYVICVLCTIVGMVTFLTRSNINIAIVSMVEPDGNASTGTNHFCPELRTGGSGGGEENITVPIYGEVFEWSPEVQGTLLGCFFWTYCVFQAPSGYVNGRYGGRWPVSLSLLVSAIITALGPVFAHISVYLLIVSRMVMGVFQSAIFPGMFVIAVTWVPIQERAMSLAMTEIGSCVGTIFLYFTSGFLVEKFTWTSLFYMPAIGSFLVFVLFCLFVRNKPEDHPFITEKEVAYINGKVDETSATNFEMELSNGQPPDDVSLASYESEKELVTDYSIPWRKMLTNKSVVSLCLFKFSRTLVFHFINSKIAYYLKVVLNEDLVSIGITYAIFTLVLMVVVLISAKISDIIILKGWLSRTNCRRLFSLFSGSASAIAFMVLVACRCNVVAVKCLFFFIAVCQGCGMASDVVVPPELTTHFSAIVYALGNMSQVTPGFVSPMFSGFILGRYGEEWIAWDIIFNTIGVFGIVCNIVFLIFIRAEKQDFDNVKEPPPRDNRTMSVVSALSGHMPY